MATKDFVINILADATKASSSIKSFGSEVGKTTSGWGKLNQGFGSVASTLAGWGVGSALKSFASDSVSAYTDAQQSAQQLQFALDKFPNTAGTSADALMQLNGQLERKTKFDDDELASGQAVLAQFGLTGSQIKEMTPLLADYAAKTGKDIPTAAGSLGKALMGQGKALKTIGVNFKDAGSVTANYDQIMGGLRSQVGGFAEQQGATGAGAAERLKNNFGELQEMVGSLLLPTLTKLTNFGVNATVWMQEHETLTKGIVIAVGALAGGFAVLNVATGVANGLAALRTLSLGTQTTATAAAAAANTGLAASTWAVSWPILAIIAGVALLIAGIVVLATHWKQVWAGIQNVTKAVADWFTSTWTSIMSWWSEKWSGVSAAWNAMWQGMGNFFQGIGNWFQGIFTSIVNWVKNNIGIIAAFIIGGPLVGMFAWLYKNNSGFRDFVKDAVQNIINFFAQIPGNVTRFFQSAGDNARNIWNGVTSFFQGIPGSIGRVFGGLADMITAPFRSAFTAIRTLWNGTIGGFGFTVPNWIPGVGGRSFKIPYLANGGTLTSSGLVMVGEQGPEILSLPAGARVTPLDHESNPQSSNPPQQSEGDIIIPVYIGGQKIEEVVVTAQQKANYKNGGR